MSEALERACRALNIQGEVKDREIVAERVVALARTGVLSAKELSDRVVDESNELRSL